MLTPKRETFVCQISLLQKVTICFFFRSFIAVADAIRTSLGPRGMDKMIQAEKGEVLITNDGATILGQIQVCCVYYSLIVPRFFIPLLECSSNCPKHKILKLETEQQV